MGATRKNGGPSRQFWILTSLGAVGLVGAVALLVRAPAPLAPPPRPQPIPMVGLSRLDGATGDAVLREEARLRDPTPLFLPIAELNAAQGVNPKGTVREPGDTFLGYPGKPAFGNADVQFAFAPAVVVPDEKRPVEATSLTDWTLPLQGMGQRDVTPPILAARGAYVDIRAAADGSSLGLEQALTEAKPPTQQEWQPMEFLAAVEPGGLVGQPSLMVSSGVEKVDQYFLEYLVKSWRVGERLSKLKTGFYVIKLGP
jgi:hypothetical protein